MSQARRPSKGAVVSNGCGPSTHASNSKTTDDTLPGTVCPKNEKQRNRRRNKIPKSIRNDLENSLVGLCDVWFEEIKPYLVRNNIKVHVHKDSEDAPSGCGSGDYQRRQLPGTSPYCSHNDPGAASHPSQRTNANYVGSCSTQPTVSKVPSVKLQAPTHHQRKAPQLSPNLTLRDCVPNQRNNDRAIKVQSPYTISVHINNKSHTAQASPSVGWRVPRLSVPVSKPKAGKPAPENKPNDRRVYNSNNNKAGAVGLRSGRMSTGVARNILSCMSTKKVHR